MRIEKPIHTGLHSNNGRKVAAKFCCLLALSVPSLAKAQSFNALDYLQQRPPVTKHYQNKRFGDHMFVEFGGGTSMTIANGTNFAYKGKVQIGEWLTPEHGVRLGFNIGQYKIYSIKPTYFNLSADYLMNMTAIAQRHYEYIRPFEVYGIAGLDFGKSQWGEKRGTEFGLHLGLRAQYNFVPYAYAYIEPGLGISKDNAMAVDRFQNVYLTAGLGYRLPSKLERLHFYDYQGEKNFWNGMFYGLAGGASYLTNGKHDYTNAYGIQGTFNFGKWITPLQGFRLTATANVINGKHEINRVNTFGLRADYIFNMHNLFGGYYPERRWWINGLVGVGENVTMTEFTTNRSALGVGVGLQGNLRLTPHYSLVIEPRVDAYQNNFIKVYDQDHFYVLPTMLLGINYTINDALAYRAQHETDYEQQSWHDHTFIYLGGGASVPMGTETLNRLANSIGIGGTFGLGRWFTSIHGARIWGQVGSMKSNNSPAFSNTTFGADYLVNFSNLAYGYNPDRRLEVTGGLGVNAAIRENTNKMAIGATASLRGTYYPSRLVGLFLEPQLKAYGKDFYPDFIENNKVNVVASLFAGLQLNMQGYNRFTARQAVAADGGYRSVLSMASGAYVPMNQLSDTKYITGTNRFSYAQNYSPISSWRISALCDFGLRENRRYLGGKVGLDWLSDLTAQTYGYNPDRVLSVSALAGFNVGVDYKNTQYYDMRFAGDVHVGAQLAVRVAPNTRIYAEPQFGYRLSSRIVESNEHFQPTVLFGVEYSMHRAESLADNGKPEKKHYVSVAAGSGLSSNSLYAHNDGVNEKTNINFALNYGQWLTKVNGLEIGVSDVINKKNEGTVHIASVRANYMMNVTAAITGNAESKVNVAALGGASLNYNTETPNDGNKLKAGFQAALRLGYNASRHIEVYMQPETDFYSTKNQSHDKLYPSEWNLNVSLGAKYKF